MQGQELVDIVKWWFQDPAISLGTRSRKLLALLGNVGSGDGEVGADLGNAVYGVALIWIYEEMPRGHTRHNLTSFNGMGNAVEGLLGCLWGKVHLQNMDLQLFTCYIRTGGGGGGGNPPLQCTVGSKKLTNFPVCPSKF